MNIMFKVIESRIKKLIGLIIEHKDKLMFLISILLMIFLIQRSHLVRSVSYDRIPEPIIDERTHVWTGLSFRNTGVPAAWSDLRSYWDIWPKYEGEIQNGKATLKLEDFNIKRDNEAPQLFPRKNFPDLTIFTTQFDFGGGMSHISFMQPFLDYPPLGGVILSLGVPQSAYSSQDIDPLYLRNSSLWLANATTILIFILTLILFKKPLLSLICSAIYSSVPTFVLSSRYALLENALIPFYLASLIFLFLALEFKDKFNKFVLNVLLIASGLLAGCAFLIKPSGGATIITGIAFLIWYRFSLKQLFYFVIPSILVSLLYFIEGFILSPSVFPSILLEQSSKRIFVGALNPITSIFKFGIKNFPIDGWWIGGFVSLILLNKDRQTRMIGVSALIMLFFVLLTGPLGYPWYFIPMIPLIVTSLGILIWELIINPQFIHSIIFFVFLVSSTLFWAYGVSGAAPNFSTHQHQQLIYKILLIVFFGGVGAISLIIPRSKIFKIIWIVCMLALVYVMIKWNFKSIFYIIQHWGDLYKNYSPNWKL